MNRAVVVFPAFAASLVEFVEALTIALAVGVTRQWRSALIGVGAAVVALALLVGGFGAALVVLVPISALRVGDRPELFAAPIVVLLAVWVAMRAGVSADLAAISLTVLVVMVGAGSLVLATHRKV
jgi:hypothetical protein